MVRHVLDMARSPEFVLFLGVSHSPTFFFGWLESEQRGGFFRPVLVPRDIMSTADFVNVSDLPLVNPQGGGRVDDGYNFTGQK